MNVAVFNRQRCLKFDPSKVAAFVEEAASFEGIRCDEIAIHFIGAAAMRRLHLQYFNDSSITDCISFPIDEPQAHYRVLGDVFVCPQVALAYAHQHGEDPYLETMLYVIHGLLHLIGYDDIKERDRKKMRAAEKRILSHLKKRHLILRGSYKTRFGG